MFVLGLTTGGVEIELPLNYIDIIALISSVVYWHNALIISAFIVYI